MTLHFASHHFCLALWGPGTPECVSGRGRGRWPSGVWDFHEGTGLHRAHSPCWGCLVLQWTRVWVVQAYHSPYWEHMNMLFFNVLDTNRVQLIISFSHRNVEKNLCSRLIFTLCQELRVLSNYSTPRDKQMQRSGQSFLALAWLYMFPWGCWCVPASQHQLSFYVLK